MSAQGRDYSAFQAPVGRRQLDGLSFAYTRVSDWSGTSMGTDPDFAGDWDAIRAAGLHRGAYWYLVPDVSPVAQAAYFVAKVKAAGLLPGDMLVCDSEELTATVDEDTLAFQRTVLELTGWPVQLIETYAPLDVAKELVATSAEFPTFWVAWPSPAAPEPAQWAPAEWRDWTFWQWGTVNGTDADAFNGSPLQLDAWIASHIPAPQPAPVPVTGMEDDMYIFTVDRADVPVGTAWPGVFSYSGGVLVHIPAEADVTALEAKGVPNIPVSYQYYLNLAGKM
jgi:hypothetical protein